MAVGLKLNIHSFICLQIRGEVCASEMERRASGRSGPLVEQRGCSRGHGAAPLLKPAGHLLSGYMQLGRRD